MYPHRTGKRLSTAIGLLAATATVGGMIGAGHAAAADPATEISAVSNAPCKVTFSIVNRTNSKSYTIDFRVDGEALTGQDYGSGKTGRISVHSEVADGTAVFTPGVTPYVSNLAPVTSSKTEDLKALGYPEKTSDQHYVVEYRMILGPSAAHRHPEWRSVNVAGCKKVSPLPGSGSLDWGSIDLGSTRSR